MTSTIAYLPLFLRVDGAAVVVTGGGPTAAAIRERMAGLGAAVRTAASVATAQDVDGAFLVIAASENRADDEATLALARERGVLGVDAFGPSGRGFLGAFAASGPVAVSVTTFGQAPMLDQRLAAGAAGGIAPHHGRLAEILAGIRGKLEARVPDDATRAAIWEQILDSPVALLLEAGQDDEAVEMAERMAWGTG